MHHPIHDETFLHYYWSYDNRYGAELHDIFNRVYAPFPLELTLIIARFLKEANAADRVEAIAITCRRSKMHAELRALAREITGVTTHTLASLGTGRVIVGARLGALVNALDPATWLSAFAYEGLPYVFNLGSHIIGLVLDHPRLREHLAMVGVRAVEREHVRGCEVRLAFSRAVRDYVRVMTRELFRRYGEYLLADLHGVYEVYLSDLE